MVGFAAGPVSRDVFGFGIAAGLSAEGDFACGGRALVSDLVWPGAAALLPRSGVAACAGFVRLVFFTTSGVVFATRGGVAMPVAATTCSPRAGVAAAGSTLTAARSGGACCA